MRYLVPMIPEESTALDCKRCLAAGENFWFPTDTNSDVACTEATATATAAGIDLDVGVEAEAEG